MNLATIKTVTLAACLALSAGNVYAASAKNTAKTAQASAFTAPAASIARLNQLGTRLERLALDKSAPEDHRRIMAASKALQSNIDKKNINAKQFSREFAALEKDMLKTEQKVLTQKYLAPVDNAMKSLRDQNADDYAYYAYKKFTKLRNATNELIENQPAKTDEIARFSAAAIKQATLTGSLSGDSQKITRVGERDAERFIAHVSWLFDQINKNSANPVDLSGKSLDQRAAAIIGKPLPPTPLQIKQAADAKAKADKAKAEADKKAANKRALDKLKADKAKKAAAKKAAAKGGK